MNARGDFFKLTEWEADYVDRRRRDAAVAGYRGPFPDPAIADAFAQVFDDHLPLAAGLGKRLADADRLVIAWDVDRPLGIIVANESSRDGLAMWSVELFEVVADHRNKGLFGHLLRVLVTEEPRHLVEVHSPEDANGSRGDNDDQGGDDGGDENDPIARIIDRSLRSLSPTRSVIDGAADLSGVASRSRVHGERLHSVDVRERARNVVITGTNGKTSCVELGRQLGEAAGSPSASFGTLGVVTAAGRTRSPRMDLGPQALPNLSERLWERGIDHVWAEGFSYALSAGLLDRFPVDAAGFTQMGMDHVNAHGSLIGYWRAKERLFETVLRDDGTVVIDPTTDGADRILDIARHRKLAVMLVGEGGVVEVKPDSIRIRDTTWPLDLPLHEPVMHRNLEVTIGCSLALGLEPEGLVTAVAGLHGAPGRFQKIPTEAPFAVVVESAHNADALEASLTEVRRSTPGRILVLVASVGSSDPMRWEPLGEVADVLADIIVVTDESPHRSDAKRIRDGIRLGCPRAADIADRVEAIQWLVDQAEAGDTIVLAGRADEDFLVDDEGSHPFPTDEALVLDAIRRSNAQPE